MTNFSLPILYFSDCLAVVRMIRTRRKSTADDEWNFSPHITHKTCKSQWAEQAEPLPVPPRHRAQLFPFRVRHVGRTVHTSLMHAISGLWSRSLKYELHCDLISFWRTQIEDVREQGAGGKTFTVPPTSLPPCSKVKFRSPRDDEVYDDEVAWWR